MATTRHIKLLTEARLAAQEVSRLRQYSSIRAGDIFLCQLSAQLLPLVLDILAHDESDHDEPGFETKEGESQQQYDDSLESPTSLYTQEESEGDDAHGMNDSPVSFLGQPGDQDDLSNLPNLPDLPDLPDLVEMPDMTRQVSERAQ